MAVIKKIITPRPDVYLDVMQRNIVEQFRQGATSAKIYSMPLTQLAYTLVNETGIIEYVVVKPD